MSTKEPEYKTPDRARAVNLANNFLNSGRKIHVTSNGVEVLAKAVLEMDRYITQVPSNAAVHRRGPDSKE